MILVFSISNFFINKISKGRKMYSWKKYLPMWIQLYKLHNDNSAMGPFSNFDPVTGFTDHVLGLMSIKNAKCFFECKVFYKKLAKFHRFFLQYVMFCRTGNDNLASFGNVGFSVATHIPFKVFDSTSTCWQPVIDNI